MKVIDHPIMSQMWNDKRNNLVINSINYQKQVNGNKNFINKNTITVGSGYSFWWTGSCGHEFLKKTANLMNNIKNNEEPCIYCAGKKATLEQSIYTLYYDSLIPFWDWKRNSKEGIFPNELTPQSNKHIYIKCDIHGEIALPRRISDIINAIVKAQRGERIYKVCKKCSNYEVSDDYNLAVKRPSLVKSMVNTGEANNIHPKANKRIGVRCSDVNCNKIIYRHINAIKDNYIYCINCIKKYQSSYTQNLIYYFLKEALPNLKFREKIFGYEADMYDCELKLIVEVDSAYYHETEYKIRIDNKKNELFKDFTFIRIRDLKCPSLNSSNFHLISYKFNNSFDFIINIIKELYEYLLDEFYSKDLKERIDVIELDINKAKEKMDYIIKETYRERSIGKLYPGLLQRINTNLIDPYMITPGSHIEIPLSCSICNSNDHMRVKELVNKEGICRFCQYKVLNIYIENSPMVRRHFKCKLKDSLAIRDVPLATFYSVSNYIPVTEITSRSSTYKVNFYCPYCKSDYISTVYKQSNNQCTCKNCGLSAYKYLMSTFL